MSPWFAGGFIPVTPCPSCRWFRLTLICLLVYFFRVIFLFLGSPFRYENLPLIVLFTKLISCFLINDQVHNMFTAKKKARKSEVSQSSNVMKETLFPRLRYFYKGKCFAIELNFLREIFSFSASKLSRRIDTISMILHHTH